jgi:hypothetical protein
MLHPEAADATPPDVASGRDRGLIFPGEKMTWPSRSLAWCEITVSDLIKSHDRAGDISTWGFEDNTARTVKRRQPECQRRRQKVSPAPSAAAHPLRSLNSHAPIVFPAHAISCQWRSRLSMQGAIGPFPAHGAGSAATESADRDRRASCATLGKSPPLRSWGAASHIDEAIGNPRGIGLVIYFPLLSPGR